MVKGQTEGVHVLSEAALTTMNLDQKGKCFDRVVIPDIFKLLFWETRK